MKHQILFQAVIFMTLSICLQGQSWNFAPPYTYSETRHFYSTDDSVVYLNIRNEFGSAFDNFTLYALNPHGELKWKQFGGDAFFVDSSSFILLTIPKWATYGEANTM